MASACVIYFPFLVLPYQRVPGLWYTPESVLTQTMPVLFGRAACCVVIGFEAGALGGAVVAAGLLVGAGGELAASGFVFFSCLGGIREPESLWPWPPVCCAAFDPTEMLPTTSISASIKRRNTFGLFIPGQVLSPVLYGMEALDN